MFNHSSKQWQKIGRGPYPFPTLLFCPFFCLEQLSLLSPFQTPTHLLRQDQTAAPLEAFPDSLLISICFQSQCHTMITALVTLFWPLPFSPTWQPYPTPYCPPLVAGGSVLSLKPQQLTPFLIHSGHSVNIYVTLSGLLDQFPTSS